METKVLRSAIETYPMIFLIPTDDSTLLSHKFIATLICLNMASIELIVARCECVYNRNSKNFKDKQKV